jgi:tagatose-6-phosphate ketose/aldose isomerase
LFTLLLPEETNDVSLAMTSSYSSMLLAGLLICHIEEIERLEPVVSKICQLGQHILDKYTDELKKMAETDFERMVFLGSGPLAGVAHESHLKVQEMSNGKIICKFDSFLGFRHGPKAVVNAGTSIVYLFSNEAYPGLYERDLVRSVNETAAGERSIAIGNGFDEKAARLDLPGRFPDEIHKQPEVLRFDLSIRFPNEINELPEEFLSVFYIIPAQIIAFYKSLHIGLSPDSPSENGAISRVVQGVNIY